MSFSQLWKTLQELFALLFLTTQTLAHWSWVRRGRSSTSQPRFLPRGLQSHSLHRVQRSPRHLPLLCQQIQFLAGYNRRQRVLKSQATDAQGQQAEGQSVQVSGVHQARHLCKRQAQHQHTAECSSTRIWIPAQPAVPESCKRLNC